jgi:hypothetical protein
MVARFKFDSRKGGVGPGSRKEGPGMPANGCCWPFAGNFRLIVRILGSPKSLKQMDGSVLCCEGP